MFRSLGVSLLTFLLLFLLGLTVIVASTRDTGILATSVLDRAQQSAATTPSAASGGQVLDAPADTRTSGQEEAGQLETLRSQAQREVGIWFGAAMALCLFVSWGWLAHAHARAGQAVGPTSARAASRAWWAGLVVCLLLAGGISLYVLFGQGLMRAAALSLVDLGLALVFVLSLLAYYVAGILAAPRVVRPSVPFATSFLR